MEKTINITRSTLRTLGTEGRYNEVLQYLKPEDDRDLPKWFLECLCAESSFLNSNNSYSFQKEILALASIAKVELTPNQIEILSDLIGNFQHQCRTPIPLSKMYALPLNLVCDLARLLTDKIVHFDTHIAVRLDLLFYDSVHELLEYNEYKELVFATICKTTKCYTNGAHNVPFNPMEKVRNKAHLTDEDYKELCKKIYS